MKEVKKLVSRAHQPGELGEGAGEGRTGRLWRGRSADNAGSVSGIMGKEGLPGCGLETTGLDVQDFLHLQHAILL